MFNGPFYDVVCRWCGKMLPRYTKSQFGSSKCKQAHYRAYKKYVTRLVDRQNAGKNQISDQTKPSNARKKRKAR